MTTIDVRVGNILDMEQDILKSGRDNSNDVSYLLLISIPKEDGKVNITKIMNDHIDTGNVRSNYNGTMESMVFLSSCRELFSTDEAYIDYIKECLRIYDLTNIDDDVGNLYPIYMVVKFIDSSDDKFALHKASVELLAKTEDEKDMFIYHIFDKHELRLYSMNSIIFKDDLMPDNNVGMFKDYVIKDETR